MLLIQLIQKCSGHESIDPNGFWWPERSFTEIERRESYTKRDYSIASWLNIKNLNVRNKANAITWSRRNGAQKGVPDYTCTRNCDLPEWHVVSGVNTFAEHNYIRYFLTLDEEVIPLLRMSRPSSIETDKDKLEEMLQIHRDRIYPQNAAQVNKYSRSWINWMDGELYKWMYFRKSMEAAVS